MVGRKLREQVTRSPIRKVGAVILRKAFDDLKKSMDYSEYGGAPLLGVNGGCIVCHGRSNAKAIKNAIRVARDFAVNEMDIKIRDKISELHSKEHETAIV